MPVTRRGASRRHPARAVGDPLEVYRQKRDFSRTREPKPAVAQNVGWPFVVPTHDARRLHYDFRLELAVVLKSWAVTRGRTAVTVDACWLWPRRICPARLMRPLYSRKPPLPP